MLVLFACKDPCPLYKSSKRKNHLKPGNLETVFLLLALKIPIKSVTSQQAKIKYLKVFCEFRICNSITVFFNIKFVHISMLDAKCFVSLKNESISPKFLGGAHKWGGGGGIW